VTIKQKQRKTYGNLNKIRNSLNFQLAKHSGNLLYRNRPIQKRLGENIKQNKTKEHRMKKTEKEIQEMGVHSEREYYSAFTVLCCGLGAGVCIALSLLVEYLTGKF
jgi:methionyl-tRNA synthetase